jgi:hypothetical protein
MVGMVKVMAEPIHLKLRLHNRILKDTIHLTHNKASSLLRLRLKLGLICK